MLVFFDTPKGDYYYGSAVAAPVFAKAMQEILPYLGVERVYTDEELKKLDIITPDLINKPIKEAVNKVNEMSLRSVVMGNGEKVISQIPEPFSHMPKNGKIILYTDSETVNQKVKVPNLVGESLYNVNKIISESNLNLKISGKDLIGDDIISHSQSTPAGTEVPIGTVITVNFIHKSNTD